MGRGGGGAGGGYMGGGETWRGPGWASPQIPPIRTPTPFKKVWHIALLHVFLTMFVEWYHHAIDSRHLVLNWSA